jgi:hypothetical protein
MINNDREIRDFTRMLESRTREGRYHECMNEIGELRRAGEIGDNFSLRTLFECLVTTPDGEPCGAALLREMGRSREGGVLMEAGGDAVTTANFSNVIGQMSYGTVLAKFDSPIYIGGDLLAQVPADTQMPIMVPGITMIGDVAAKVGENEDYPVIGFGQQYITLPRIDKEGFILAITEEAVREDKTGQVMERLNGGAEAMAIAVEKERLNCILGVTSTYSRNGGPVQATYADTHTQGDFDNLVATNALTDFTNVQASDLAFSLVTDPDTGEPIGFPNGIEMVVPWNLRIPAWRVMNADLVRTGNLAGSQVLVQSGNPLTALGMASKPYSNQYVSSIVGNSTTWFRGDFKGAFVERVYWPTQVVQETPNSGVGFSRDVISRTKVRRKTVTAAREPRKVQKNTA